MTSVFGCHTRGTNYTVIERLYELYVNKPLNVNGLCLWLVREIQNIDVVGLDRNQSSLPPGLVTIGARDQD